MYRLAGSKDVNPQVHMCNSPQVFIKGISAPSAGQSVRSGTGGTVNELLASVCRMQGTRHSVPDGRDMHMKLHGKQGDGPCGQTGHSKVSPDF